MHRVRPRPPTILSSGSGAGAACVSFPKEKAMTMLTNTPRFAPGELTLRSGFAIFLARIGRVIDRWVAAEIARRERQATLAALHVLDDHQLNDIGICRYQIGDVLSEETRRRLQRSQRF